MLKVFFVSDVTFHLSYSKEQMPIQVHYTKTSFSHLCCEISHKYCWSYGSETNVFLIKVLYSLVQLNAKVFGDCFHILFIKYSTYISIINANRILSSIFKWRVILKCKAIKLMCNFEYPVTNLDWVGLGKYKYIFHVYRLWVKLVVKDYLTHNWV